MLMKQIDETMSGRLALPSKYNPQSDNTERHGNYKRNAWMLLFGSSFMFWALVAAGVWYLWH